MGIDPNLLTKAAKVYEAAESVDGMQPKHVYESHKKCAPGEFNMHKEGYAQLQTAIKRAVDFSADKKMVAAAPKLNNRSWDTRKMMPERSRLADEIAYQQHYAKGNAAETAAFQRTVPHVLGGLGAVVGGQGGKRIGQGAGAILGAAAPFMDAREKNQELRDAMQQDAGMRPADLKNMPPQPRPQLKINIRGVPPPSPPRGTGMGALKKSGSDWKGFDYSNVGPGGLISTRTLPKADATAKDWKASKEPAGDSRAAVGRNAAQPPMKQVPPQMKPVMRPIKKAGALSFGQYVKQALTGIDVAHAINFGPTAPVFTPGRAAGLGAGAGGLAGGGLGAVLGGLYGAFEPGEESTYDEKGHVAGRKRRGRLHGALRGLAGGALLGGAAGAGIGGAGGYVNADLLEQERKRMQLENLRNAR